VWKFGDGKFGDWSEDILENDIEDRFVGVFHMTEPCWEKLQIRCFKFELRKHGRAR
jgi:hypothetical protein